MLGVQSLAAQKFDAAIAHFKKTLSLKPDYDIAVFNLSKEKAKLTAMGIEPTNEEIAKRLNVDESEVIEMDRRLARADASLDTPVKEGEARSTTRLELLPSMGESPRARIRATSILVVTLG